MYETLKSLLLPPVSLLVLAIAGIFWRRKHLKLGEIIAGTAVCLLLVSSLPIVSYFLLSTLQTAPPLPTEGPFPEAGAIIILSAEIRHGPEFGGLSPGPMTLERLRYGAWLERHTHLPILVSGGTFRGYTSSIASVMRQVLTEEFGVPVQWTEDTSQTTAENAKRSSEILKANGISKVLLVTHAWHMPRATLAFEEAGITVVPAPTAFAYADARDPYSFIPSSDSIRASYLAAHEWAGLIFYKIRYSFR